MGSNYADMSAAFSLQMAVVVYGAEPRVHFLLSRHSNSETLLRELDSIPFTERPGSNIGVCERLGGVGIQTALHVANIHDAHCLDFCAVYLFVCSTLISWPELCKVKCISSLYVFRSGLDVHTTVRLEYECRSKAWCSGRCCHHR